MSSHAARRQRRVLSAMMVAAAVTAVAIGLPSAADATAARTVVSSADHSVAAGTYIIQLTVAPTRADALATVRSAIKNAGGRVISSEPNLGMLVASLTPAQANTVGSLAVVKAVSADQKAHPMSLGFDPSTQPGSMTKVTRDVDFAQNFWKHGITGAGVDVAIIDTGVAPVPTLSDPNKVVVGPDLSFESQSPTMRNLDTFGHGTAMGSIIAGREVAKSTGTAYAADTTHYYGMAPDARLVSVKVGSADGAVDVSQLIGAIDWVVQNRTNNSGGANLNIRVLNLSFGTDSTQSWEIDPLSQAAEVATRAGILVVAAAGNDGQDKLGFSDPAYNPHLLAVGALDSNGTVTKADDKVPSFSQHSGNGPRNPDVIAPGVGIISAAVPGSAIATTYPNALLGENKAYIRGSGTSQAAAMVSGAAALLFQKYPWASGLQIQGILETTCSPVGSNLTADEGSGQIDLNNAWNVGPQISDAATTIMLGITSTQSTGTGTLEGARGTMEVTIDGMSLNNERDIFGNGWRTKKLSSTTDQMAAWNGGTLNGSVWTGGSFAADTSSVAGRAWGGRSWSSAAWTGSAWSGNAWTGRTWAGRTWSGRTWSSGSWGDPVTNTNGGWDSRTWATSTWK